MKRLLHAIALAMVLLLAARTGSAQTQGQNDGFFTTSDGIKIHYITLGDTGSWVVLTRILDGRRVGAPTPQLYIDSIASFINTYDQK